MLLEDLFCECIHQVTAEHSLLDLQELYLHLATELLTNDWDLTVHITNKVSHGTANGKTRHPRKLQHCRLPNNKPVINLCFMLLEDAACSALG
jgi:predicted RNA-binding protein associated with RNAse of E/G family